MTNKKVSTFTFPLGYHKFRNKQVFNYQLNRWYSWGYARFEDMKEAGQKINSFGDWKIEMAKLAEEAVSERRYMNAAFYYRAAEFYALLGDPDREFLYDKFSDLFCRAFEDDDIERFEVPYNDACLPTMKTSPPIGVLKKGTIVLHGGFDSFIEEFYSWMRYFSDHGFEVIAFEGPGQGAARRKHGLALDHEWEKPTKAILDFFDLNNVTLLGISMGGWYCLRAAAFEPRIKRVIAQGHAIDYMKMLPLPLEWLVLFLCKYFGDFVNKTGMRQLKKGGMQAWSTSQSMYITKKKTPVEALQIHMLLSEKNLHPDLIKQDVLILTGRNDHFIPIKAHHMQLKALTNAKSVTARVFTKSEQAQNHCQVGNTGLALDVILNWIDEKS